MRIKDLATRATKLLTGNAYMVVDNGTKVEKIDYAELAKQIITEYNTQTLAGSAQTVKSALDVLNRNMKRVGGWTNIAEAHISESLTDYLDQMTPYGSVILWSTSANSEAVGAPSAHSYYYECIVMLNTSTILVIATRMNKNTPIQYMKQKYANTWGEWIALPTSAEVKTTMHPNITDVLTPAQDVTILCSYVSVRNGLVILDCNFTQTSTNTADRFTFKNGYKPDVLNTNIAPVLMYSNNAVSDSVMFINPTTLTIFGATPVANQAYYFRLIYFIQ